MFDKQMTLSFTCLKLFNHQFLEVVICFQIPSDWIRTDVKDALFMTPEIWSDIKLHSN